MQRKQAKSQKRENEVWLLDPNELDDLNDLIEDWNERHRSPHHARSSITTMAPLESVDEIPYLEK
jgi:hypothetical protein